MAHLNENHVTHNPFEGENASCKRNDAVDAGVGFLVSFIFFVLMFVIAIIVDAVA
ncbi:YqzM family protein [Ureibacillus sp. FSL K6-8385]|uniref:YqzM family protein n=1 Tax=Ureibacillus terrenus TaxID=118246 RepID=A0A540V507_9BACL|nr:YqzM family protein [Ureibacillus terrenus]MED3661504.1 YqzM family protein [Ureibacillus terrenus]MED3763971.1 YqzM family protein [Ureibacillus terrenus]TQE91808.1 YqzM family protein [Ureibacillus terrenus]